MKFFVFNCWFYQFFPLFKNKFLHLMVMVFNLLWLTSPFFQKWYLLKFLLFQYSIQQQEKCKLVPSSCLKNNQKYDHSFIMESFFIGLGQKWNFRTNRTHIFNYKFRILMERESVITKLSLLMNQLERERVFFAQHLEISYTLLIGEVIVFLHHNLFQPSKLNPLS